MQKTDTTTRKRYQFSVCNANFTQSYFSHFTTFCNQTLHLFNFRMLFNTVVMNFTISIFLEILSIMQSVHFLFCKKRISFPSCGMVFFCGLGYRIVKFPVMGSVCTQPVTPQAWCKLLILLAWYNLLAICSKIGYLINLQEICQYDYLQQALMFQNQAWCWQSC